MSSKVLFLPTDGRSIMAERQVPVMETAGIQAFDGGRSSAARRAAAAALPNLQAAYLLSEAASVDRIRSAAEKRMQRLATAGVQSADVLASENADDEGVLFLDAIGGMVVDDLPEEHADRLRNAGFKVYENDLAFFAPPLAAATQEVHDIWHLDDCGASRLHGQQITGRGALIGILDTGIDPHHPEFEGKRILFAEFDMMGRVVGTMARDSGDHGTHVAAIAAGRNVGVARDADIAMAAVLTYDGSGYLAQIAAGMNWLAGIDQPGAPAPDDVTVVNASLGSSGYRDYLYQPIANARAIGIPFVGSIGNSGDRGENYHGSPGNYDISIGVGATDLRGGIGSFSDWGTVADHDDLPKPDLCAPGVNVRAAVPGGGYDYKSGTSMAAPCVAGAVALLIEEDPTIRENVPEIVNRLYQRVTAASGSDQARFGKGRLSL